MIGGLKKNGVRRGVLLVRYCFSLVFYTNIIYFSSYFYIVEVRLIRTRRFSFGFPVLLRRDNYLISIVVCFISGRVLIYRRAYIEEDKNFNRFIVLVCLFVLAINFLIFIPRLLFLFLGWDGLGIVSFVLVVYYQNKNSLGAGIITVLRNRIGDVFLFFRITIWGCLGYWYWDGVKRSEVFLRKVDLTFLGFGLLAASITKRAQFPFCAWLPAAIAAPTPVSALVHSSTLVTAGVFLLCRFRGVLFRNREVCQSLFLISLITILLSGGVCCFELDIKKVIAYSTLRQLGVMIFSVSLGLVGFGFFHLITHAVFKALIFLCAGFVIHFSRNVQDFRFLRGVWWARPVVRGSILSSAFCLRGVPFLSGFYSKDLILEQFLTTNISLRRVLWIGLATILTIGYRFRLCAAILIRKRGIEFIGGRVNKLYIFPVIRLEFVGIFEGRAIQNRYERFTSFRFVIRFVKNSVRFILLGGLVLGFYLLLPKKTQYPFFINFLSSVIFLREVRGQIGRKSCGGLRKRVFITLDQGGFELIAGGMGASNLISRIGKWSLKVRIARGIYYFRGFSLFFIAIIIGFSIVILF